MADNYVSISIRAQDGAKPELDDLKLKLDELKNKVAEAKATVDTKDGEAKVLALDAQLEALSKKVASPRIDVAGAARALAQVAAVDAELDRMKLKTDRMRAEADAAGAEGLVGRLLMGSGGQSGLLGSGGLADKIPVGGGLMSVTGIGAIAVAVEALLPEVVGLVSGFAAAGAGAGAFALLAHPALSSLQQDYQALNAAQDKYQQAQRVEALDPTPKHLKAEHEALVSLQARRQAMTQDEATAVGGIARLRQEYDKLTAAFQPEAFKVFNGFLKLANDLLPDVTPFAKTFADALSGLLGKADKFAGSKGFKDWLNQFHSLEGPAITAIGDGIGKVAGSVGKLLTVMSSKDVVNAINIAFTILNGTIQIVTYMVKRLMDNWDGMSVAVKHSWYDIKRWTDDVTHVFDILRHATAEFGHDWAHTFDSARHTVASWGHDVAHDFDVVRHGAASVAHDIAHYWDDVRHATAQLGHDIAVWFDRIRHDIAHWADDVRNDVGKVVSWFKALPGRIVSAVASLPGMLEKAGVKAIEGLLGGMRSMVGGAVSTVEGWGHDIANALGAPFGIHFSEPSEAALMIRAGRNIPAGLAKGVRSAMPDLTSVMRQAANTVSGPRAGGALAGAAGNVKLQLQFSDNGDAFMKAIRQAVRVRGGNVQAVLGNG